MKKIILLALIAVTFSCKNEKTQTPTEEAVVEVEEKKPEKFVIELTMRMDNSDGLRLFANGVFINNNRVMNINITEQISKSDDFNTVILDLPENIRPDYEVGINLGSKEVKKIEFMQIKISYGNIEFIVTPDKLNDYFYFSKHIAYVPEIGTIQTRQVDGKHDPIMYLKKNLVDKINL
jgi:hypothetical protein